MATALQLLLWITFVSTSAYKCNEEGCSINNSDDVRNFENHHRSQHLVSESPRMVERTASYSVVSKFPRVKTSSKLEDGTRKENGSYKILNENRRFYPKTDVRIGGQTEDKIVFPGLTSDRPQFVPIISEECKRTGICEDVPNYPLDKIGNIIASLGEARRTFQIDQLDVSDVPDIVQRLGPRDENMELCVFKEKIVYPQAAPDKDGKWYMVVNQKENPLQGFRVEICEADQSPCADFATFLPGYQARCVQKHVRRSMQALDEAGVVTEKQLKIPSCCSCVATLSIT